jgi:hypothetical protein
MRLGDNQYKKEGMQICTPSISLEQAAELLNVSRRTVATVKAVEREAPELIKRIEIVRRSEARDDLPPTAFTG